ncbi:hypothetical protein I2486_12510 [Cellulophaga sp. E16_2]|uniref:hypothetical protein n=1 Tax=Cellulophaga sp. E16_2 TaxID=2789297 RepID=UPI001A935236|nr:hypothetical protein [Cellulophaga sp. E16_2]MBO0592222.1 hypothetical protein [Cellulophaga sp. E16_2]
MPDTNFQNNLPKKFTTASVYETSDYIGFSELDENLKILVSSLKVKYLIFKYERKDKKTLLGLYTNFNFWLESEEKKLILLDCKINRNTLYDFLSILNKFCQENIIILDNHFEKDGYRIDILKKQIVRKIYKEEN